jgi:hypothetical protein
MTSVVIRVETDQITMQQAEKDLSADRQDPGGRKRQVQSEGSNERT